MSDARLPSFSDISGYPKSRSPKKPSRKGKEIAIEGPTSPTVKRNVKGKHTKQKSLPKALTPPPELDPAQLETALNLVRSV